MNSKRANEVALNNKFGYFECPKCGVVYQNSIKDELNRQECIYCNAGMTKDILKTICEEYAGPIQENGYLNPEGKAPVDWICSECGCKYPASMQERFHFRKSCTYCAGLHVIPGKTSLLITHPEMMNEWRSEINMLVGLDSNQMLANTSKKAWWKCSDCGQI